jgi:hypothetical protein
MKRLVVSAFAGLLFLSAAPAARAAHGPYVVLRDDGTLNGKVTSPALVLDTVSGLYDKTKAPRPDILSVWTAFDMDKSQVETLFDPAGNDVKGIGLEQYYAGDGTMTSDYPPLRAMLLHNNVLALPSRATLQHAPTEAFGDYIFLLELSHVWGPGIKVPPAPDAGAGADNELIGFPFHWSFWMDSGGSPAGGNRWKDNGDGTYSIAEQSPADITYSMLDLYLMGLADPSEVTPFGVLESAVPPPDAKDPFTGRAYNQESFPWFGGTPFTVTATRRTITIDDVIAKNGARTPARASSPQSFKLGIALVVAQNATDADVAKAEAAMDVLAVRLAPAFARATRGRGTLDVVTKPVADTLDAGADAGDAPPDDAPLAAAAPSTSSGGGCSTAAATDTRSACGTGALLLAVMAGALSFAIARIRRK